VADEEYVRFARKMVIASVWSGGGVFGVRMKKHSYHKTNVVRSSKAGDWTWWRFSLKNILYCAEP